ncbi:MAG: hypothetical protein U0350_10140 [Caldilineaceae bacterium]
MYTVLIETGNLVETPPFVRATDHTVSFLGPGARAEVFFVILGERGASPRVTVSGATGEVAYGGQASGVRAKANDFRHGPLNAREPFRAGQTAIIVLNPEPPLDIGDARSMIIGHNDAGPSPSWYLRQVSVVHDTGTPVAFPVNAWLMGEQRAVKLTPTGFSYIIPAGLTLTYIDQQLHAHWQAVTDATGYEFRLHQANGTLIFAAPPVQPNEPSGADGAKLTETSVSVPGNLLKAGDIYTAQVRELLGDVASDWSAPVAIQIPQISGTQAALFGQAGFDQARFDIA